MRLAQRARAFGIMFVPDKLQALREARRVVKDGGLLCLSVWDAIEKNAHALACAEAIEGLFPGDEQVRFRVPYEMHDPALLRSLLADAGFHESASTPCALRWIGSVREPWRSGRSAARRDRSSCAPSMGAILEVEVLLQAGHSERSEAQLREGDRAWEGSVERNREPMDKNRIRGDAEQGEQAMKLRSSRGQGSGGVNPAVVRGRIAFLPGEISPCA